MNELKSRSQKCILVVDDSVDNLQLMQFVLETEGYNTKLVNNGYEALNTVKEYQPDLILLDVMMPKMNGYEVVYHLREDKDFSSIPICLLTADKYVNCRNAIAVGANALIHKPVDIKYLLTKIEEILGLEK
jgi:CheY-like chemotaxis protein